MLNRATFVAFVKTNFALITILLTAFAVEEVRDNFKSNLRIWLTALIAIEAIAIIFIILIFNKNRKEGEIETLIGDADDITLLIRDGTTNDIDGIERIYGEWFSQKIAINDDEFHKIMSRGIFTRIAEVKRVYGSESRTTIDGYYSLWPISMPTFDDLKNRVIRERDISSDMVLEYGNPLAKVLYIAEISTSGRSEEFIRGTLINDMMRLIAQSMNDNNHLQCVATWPYTKKGKNYVQKYKMVKVNSQIFGPKFFVMERDRVFAQAGRFLKGQTFRKRWLRKL